MLVVLAGRDDRAARRFVYRWDGEARLLTCRDLSTYGWRYSPGAPGGTAVIDERVVETAAITAVLTRLPAVSERDLGAIAIEDRSYVAAEMTAYLSAWLSDLECPVLNPPSPYYLMGPHLRKEIWTQTATLLGIPVVPVRHSVPREPENGSDDRHRATITITVIGRRTVGEVQQSVADAGLALAQAAGAPLLRACFLLQGDEPALVDVDHWVDVADPAVADAIASHLANGAPA